MPNSFARVLLVDDDEDDALLTRATLADGFGQRFSMDWAGTYARGLEGLTTGNYDVALVDYNLGRETGIELLRAATARGCRTPVIMLTGQSDRATDLNAMHAGAADYFVKGRVTGDMLERSIRYARERHRLLEEIRSLSLSDELTGLGNRRAFFTFGEQRLQSMERTASLGILIFADVDGLKEVNDSLGHEFGDALLIDAARVLRTTFRRTDLIARLGGDEFVVLADVSSEEDVHFVCDRLQRQVELQNASLTGDAPRLAISAGAMCFRGAQSISLQELVAVADARMLQQKKCGRGRATPESSSDVAA